MKPYSTAVNKSGSRALGSGGTAMAYLKNRWKLAVGLEPGGQVSLLELLQETGVGCPE